MAREKKITIKPAINLEIQGRQHSVYEPAVYPLYFEVTYNRKYTKFPFGDYWMSNRDEKDFLEDSFVKEGVSMVKNIIRFESERNPEFEIKGLASRIKSYISPIFHGSFIVCQLEMGEILKESISASLFENWLRLPTLQKIFRGVQLLADDLPADLKSKIGTTQILATAAGERSVYAWMIRDNDKNRVESVRSGFRKTKDHGGPPGAIAEFGDFIDYNKPVSYYVNESIELGAQIIDREIVIGVVGERYRLAVRNKI